MMEARLDLDLAQETLFVVGGTRPGIVKQLYYVDSAGDDVLRLVYNSIGAPADHG